MDLKFFALIQYISNQKEKHQEEFGKAVTLPKIVERMEEKPYYSFLFHIAHNTYGTHDIFPEMTLEENFNHLVAITKSFR